jgi:hypothetical protein
MQPLSRISTKEFLILTFMGSIDFRSDLCSSDAASAVTDLSPVYTRNTHQPALVCCLDSEFAQAEDADPICVWASAKLRALEWGKTIFPTRNASPALIS